MVEAVGDLLAGVEAEFLEYVLDVLVYCVPGEHEFRGYLAVGKSVRNKKRHFLLTWSQGGR